uniref:Pseudouridine-5'-phosphatase n=1 Tax=Ciona intestinalis TaxID=7719 RepID=H2XQT3_CIOIN
MYNITIYISKQSHVTHVIFDMDGLLLNTEDLYTEAFQNICSEYGKEYTWSIKMHCMGQKPDASAKYTIDQLNLPLTTEQWKEKLGKQLNVVFSRSKLLPGAKKLVSHLKSKGIPIAICSGSSKAAFVAKTSHHSEFFSQFDPIVLCGDDPEVKHGKPHPDAYNVTNSRFAFPPNPKTVLVFEDAPNGVIAGVEAGMQVVMVPDHRVPNTLTEKATVALKSLEDFKPEDFGLPAYDEYRN